MANNLDASSTMLKAVIFDLDGVVADSHPIHEVAWKSLLAEAGLHPDTVNVDFLYAGHPRRAILKHYLGTLKDSEIQHWSRRKDELYERAAKNLQTKPGIPRVLAQLHDAGIACALATSAGRKRTLESLKLLGIGQYFSVVTTGDDVQNPKPAPDIFLLAVRKIGVGPEDSVVVEDSVAGVQASVAGGMKCVGFTSAERADELRQAGADDVLTDFPKDAVRYFEVLVSSQDLSLVATPKQLSRRER
jgi:HAD superfamily hydrolase (TIGR01509 family)